MIASAKVPLQEWLAAVKPFLKAKAPRRGESGELMLTCEGGQMVLRYGGVETQAEAEGAWPGAAFVDWKYIQRSAKVPPLKDPVLVEVSNDRLKIEGSIFPCRWEPKPAGKAPTFANEPAAPKPGRDTAFVTLVGMGMDYPDEKVATLGLTAQVEKARAKKSQLIAEAARILAPLEITEADLELLVRKTLGYKYTQR